MSIKKINEFPVASGVNLTSDDIFLMMDDPSGEAATKKVSLSTLSTFLGLELDNNYITNLGSVSGSTSINYDTNRSIQTLTLDGPSTTFTKGTGWPTSSSISIDTVLRITVTSATSITWTIITDWFSQPPAGALSIGTHLVLLRAIGSSIMEGHYIGSKTN
jgi:hypothetical protein